MFNQYDFDEVTVDRIVEAAGGIGTFYIYFNQGRIIASFVSDYVSKVVMTTVLFSTRFPGYICTKR